MIPGVVRKLSYPAHCLIFRYEGDDASEAVKGRSIRNMMKALRVYRYVYVGVVK